ncbi:ABC transporter ATP-binding protein [Anaerocolumna aminovalerica]|uniref:ABC transporter ATP-binding protein n=1 Tax=Anaerocolumna aminovalerica TaxID=1527 RepID=UPI001FA87B16|nr:ATP-binding cassette domain-containing protein [Anaerocolumna aminovalerica]
MEPMICLKKVCKEFKTLNRKKGRFGFIKDLFSNDYSIRKAVNQVSLQVEKGEIVGFIGPNGAGKSTMIKMLTGVLIPTEGEIIVNGFKPYKDRVKYVKEIGVVMGQRSQLWWDLSVEDSFKVMKEMYELSDEAYHKNMEIFDNEVQISELYDKSVRHLSLGQKMLCELVAILLYNPKIIFLDEPTIGLDISIKTKIRNIIKRMNLENGVTVILTTHDISDIEALCERIVIIDHGTLIFDDSIGKMKKLMDANHRVIEVIAKDPIKEATLTELEAKLNQDSIRIASKSKRKVELVYQNDRVDLNNVFAKITHAIQIEDISISDTKIEDIIKQIYEGNLL